MRTIEEVLAYVEQSRLNDIERANTTAAERTARIRQNFAIAPALQFAGFYVEMPRWDWQTLEGIRLELGEDYIDKLITLRKMLGKLKLDYKEVDNARRKTVRVILRSEDYPGISVVYVTKLKGGRCRIEAHKRKAYTSHSLVCDR